MSVDAECGVAAQPGDDWVMSDVEIHEVAHIILIFCLVAIGLMVAFAYAMFRWFLPRWIKFLNKQADQALADYRKDRLK